MKFEERELANAIGWALAHSLKCGGKRLPKGTVLSERIVNQLADHDINTAQVFLLDDTDIDEDTAAVQAATLICGPGLSVRPAGRGRANLVAESDGVFLPGDAVNYLNQLDDAFSVASLRSASRVNQGQLAATVKLIPYGLAAHILEENKKAPQCSVAKFQSFRAALVMTGPEATPKTMAALTERVERLHGILSGEMSSDHAVKPVCDALAKLTKTDSDLVLLLGASAISDIRDVLPTALQAAGGKIIKLGMPADPGNLLMLGQLGKKTVIGLPGCARSPALNGLDWILERFAAGMPLDKPTITSLGTGGLLKEPVGRQVPRTQGPSRNATNLTNFSAVVLAAGRSTRAGNAHKLLSKIGDTPVITATLNCIGKCMEKAGHMDIVVITGHDAERLKACLRPNSATIIHNEQFTSGMGSSLALGIQSLGRSCSYAFVCLADMPFIQPSTFLALMKQAKDQAGAAILIPTFHGKRGHPVLWSQHFFPELRKLGGDSGGKAVIQHHSEKIIEVPVEDPGILIDLDTPEMLAQFGITPTDR